MKNAAPYFRAGYVRVCSPGKKKLIYCFPQRRQKENPRARSEIRKAR
jgi:hypothetical protein